jgi:hypothetical protein
LTCILCTKGIISKLTIPIPAPSENNHEDDFSGSDDDFLCFYDE